MPKDYKGERVTFAFAGGLGYQTQPKTDGFVLEVNGKEALRFDLPEPKVWTMPTNGSSYGWTPAA